MSRRGTYGNSWNSHRNRIDARTPGPEKAAGIRRIHRDTDGSVIGGVMPDGTPVGTRAQQGPVDGSRIGNPTTSGLDRWRTMNPNAPAAGQASIAASRGNAQRTTAAPAGSDLLRHRQALHQDMLQAGRAGVTPDMQTRAQKLGVNPASWRRVAAAVPQTPGMIATNTPAPAIPPTIKRPAAVAAVPAVAPGSARSGPSWKNPQIASTPSQPDVLAQLNQERRKKGQGAVSAQSMEL